MSALKIEPWFGQFIQNVETFSLTRLFGSRQAIDIARPRAGKSVFLTVEIASFQGIHLDFHCTHVVCSSGSLRKPAEDGPHNDK